MVHSIRKEPKAARAKTLPVVHHLPPPGAGASLKDVYEAMAAILYQAFLKDRMQPNPERSVEHR
jgi:hypothetical protein